MPIFVKKQLLFLMFFLLSLTSKLVLGNELANLPVDLNTVSYSVAQGLSQSTVTSIVEDNEGFIWIGTLNGLNRFDGSKFQHFYANETSGLPSSFIRSLAFSDEGVLYVGTDKGLVLYNRDTEKFTQAHPSVIPRQLPVWFMLNEKDKLYIGSEKQIFIVNRSANNLIKTWKDNRLDGVKRIERIDNSVIIRSYNGKVFELASDQLQQIATNSIDIIKTNNKIKIFSKSKNHTSFKNKNISNLYVPNIKAIIANNENQPIGIQGNYIFKYTNDNETINIGFVNKIKSSFDKPGFFITKSGMYITTVNFGFIHIKNKANLVQKISNMEHNIWSISKENEKIFITTDSSEINEYNQNLNLVNSYESKIKGPKSTIVTSKYIFIASSQGFYRINLKNKKIKLLFQGRFTTVKKSNNNNHLYIGKDDGQLYKIRSNGAIIKKYLLMKTTQYLTSKTKTD